jgi:hypothetical protein
MSSFPGSTCLLKGAIIGIDPFNPLARVVVVQYNPDALVRTLQLAESRRAGQGLVGGIVNDGVNDAGVETMKGRIT